MKRLIPIISSFIVAMSLQPTLYAQGGLEQRISELSQQIASEMTIHQKTTIAIIEFSDLEGNVTNFGRFLAEELITKLYQTKKFKVIERQLLNKVMEEHVLSLTGVIDTESAMELGKILGVDAICSGTITELAQNLRVNARIIDTETGEIFAVASTNIFKDESVIGLMSSGTGIGSGKTRKELPKKASVSSVQKVEANGFTFELVECKMLGTTVICDVLVTNDHEDRKIALYGSGVYGGSNRSGSRMILNTGNEYKADLAKLGSKHSRGFWPSENLLVNGVPTKAVLEFKNVTPKPTVIALLELSCKSEDYFTAQFRNISITR
ncbi:MAG: hypothetical protein IIB40_06165 [Candidatus Marinimicrobia bacterium]|nr:hypothetical protein [Candidatus Neomarinimicrobiota bacterium]